MIKVDTQQRRQGRWPNYRPSASNRRLLGEVAEILVGVATRSTVPSAATHLHRVLTVRSLLPGGLLANSPTAVRVLGRLTDRHRLKAGDVVISARSTSLLAGVVPPELDGMLFNSTLLAVRCQPSLHPRLLAAYINHADGQAALQALAQSATAQMNITARALQKLEIPVPPVDVQMQLVELLYASDEAFNLAQEAAHERHRLAAEAVMSIMSRAEQVRRNDL